MYENFRVAIYVPVQDTRRLADRKTFQRQFERIRSQLKFDKVYLEVYRSRVFAMDEQVSAVREYFAAEGIEVAGGVTTALDETGPLFFSFQYQDPDNRAECKAAVELAAGHFSEVILDDFFFFNSKTDADIKAKGARSWTQYRLDTMREATSELVLKPARAVNPDVRVTVKYPNWYEHFPGLGFDLEHQSQLFDSIYTGTETRDPYMTDQLLQQYQSYLTYRYFSNIRPDGGNRGGWVDIFWNRYIDRYAEQLWDTLFAGAREITLFAWWALASRKVIEPGEREAWASLATCFDWDTVNASYSSAVPDGSGPGWARAAGYALEQVDGFLGRLGRPVGIPSYRPYHASGEEYLHNYLGNIGIPIELTPVFPESAHTVLLTECAKCDPAILDRIKSQLTAGGNVIITSGLVRALQDRGLDDIVEIEYTGRRARVNRFIDGYGAGQGRSLNDEHRESAGVELPELRFLTNDSWPIIRATAGAKGYPLILMHQYSSGVLYILTIPDNPADLYCFPRALLTQIKRYLADSLPVRLEADALVSLFVYDNGTFIVQSFRDEPVEAVISVRGQSRLRHLITEDVRDGESPVRRRDTDRPESRARTNFTVVVQPHSYEVFEMVE